MCYSGKCPLENSQGGCTKGGAIPCPHEVEEPLTEWEIWCQEVQKLIGVDEDDFDTEAWRCYFEDGYAPEDAVEEDASYD